MYVLWMSTAVVLGASSAFVPFVVVAFVVVAALSSVAPALFLLRRFEVVLVALSSLALFFLLDLRGELL